MIFEYYNLLIKNASLISKQIQNQEFSPVISDWVEMYPNTENIIPALKHHKDDTLY